MAAATGETSTPKPHEVISFMFECCTKLNLSSVSLATSCVAFHKFNERADNKDYDSHTIATACIFLASKVEEEPTRIRDIINVCHRVLHPKKYLKLDDEYWDLKDTLAKIELQVLRILEFRVIFDHPHKYILHYLMSLSHLFNEKKWEKSGVSTIAWAILRDSYHGTICLEYPPEIIALSCISLAFKFCKLKVPFRHEVPWWKALYKDCKDDKLQEIQVKIIKCYEKVDKK